MDIRPSTHNHHNLILDLHPPIRAQDYRFVMLFDLQARKNLPK